MAEIKIGKSLVGPEHPVYFIADIASNHCGELSIAKELVHACAESGVDAVKMQNFTAASLVSDYGFKNLTVETHQSAWKQSVFDSYDAASIPLSWTEELKSLCDTLDLAYLTSPYSIELVNSVAPHVAAFKVGSGDITWLEVIEAMGNFELPILIATGASRMEDVEAAMQTALATKKPIALMQCNTEYTANLKESEEDKYKRFKHINLKALDTFAKKWPGVPLGLSDHTHGAMTVLGAVGLFDCCIVEKHFSMDNTLEGQDHSFSMTPASWSEMSKQTANLKAKMAEQKPQTFDEKLEIVKGFVDDPKALELSVGSGVKQIEENEQNTVIVQRRAIRVARDLPKGHNLAREDLEPLRPCPVDGISPVEIGSLVGKTLAKDFVFGEHLTKDSFE